MMSYDVPSPLSTQIPPQTAELHEPRLKMWIAPEGSPSWTIVQVAEFVEGADDGGGGEGAGAGGGVAAGHGCPNDGAPQVGGDQAWHHAGQPAGGTGGTVTVQLPGLSGSQVAGGCVPAEQLIDGPQFCQIHQGGIATT